MSTQSAKSHYLVGPVYDWAFFLLPPILALGVGALISGSAFSNEVFALLGQETTSAELGLGVVIHGHLGAVFFRSHGNREVFGRFPKRFIWVPLVLWAFLVAVPTATIVAAVVATFWDVWHSGAQTFGFARIYDRNAGAPPETGRRLDFWLNQLLYAGPILAGATLIDHVECLEDLGDIGGTFFTHVPAYMAGHQGTLSAVIIGGGIAYLLFYTGAYWRFYRQGYRVSPLKLWLLLSTGLVSILAWGFNSWGEAFFIMNLFHAVQYFALVWTMEGRKMGRGERSFPRALQLLLFFGAALAYGLLAQLSDPSLHAIFALTLVVSLMHFWYDGFIWSVRRSEV